MTCQVSQCHRSQPKWRPGDACPLRGQTPTFAWDVGILVRSRNWNIPRITWSIIPIVQKSRGTQKVLFFFLDQSKKWEGSVSAQRSRNAAFILQSLFPGRTPMVVFPWLEDELYCVAFEPKDLFSDEQKSAGEMLTSSAQKKQPEGAFLEVTAKPPAQRQIQRFLLKLVEL